MSSSTKSSRKRQNDEKKIDVNHFLNGIMERCWSKRIKENKNEKRPRSEIIKDVKRWYDIGRMANDYNNRLSAIYKDTKRLDSPILLSSIRQQGIFRDLFLSQTFVFGQNQIIMGFNIDNLGANFVIRTRAKEVVLDNEEWEELREHQKTTKSLRKFLKDKKIKLNAVLLQHFNELVNDTAPLMDFYIKKEDDVALYYLHYEELSDEGKPVEFFQLEEFPDTREEIFKEQTIDYMRLFLEIGIMCKHYLWCRQAILRMILKEEEEEEEKE